MENNNKAFSYTYSAKQQEEIKKIREKYVSKEGDKMQQLRRLDASVSGKATTVALILGIIGTLILGGGMSLCMVAQQYFPGIALGILGISFVSVAYPTYMHLIKKGRQRIAPEILRLTDELMK